MQKIKIPSLDDFEIDDCSVSNNQGMLGKMSASAWFGDEHLFVLVAELNVLNSDASDDDERSMCSLSMDIRLNDVVLASIQDVDYEYHGNSPGDHLREEFALGLDGNIIPIFMEKGLAQTDEYDFSDVLSEPNLAAA